MAPDKHWSADEADWSVYNSVTLALDCVASQYEGRNGRTTTWFPLVDGVDIRAGDWFVIQDADGLARLAVDGDGDRTKFCAITGRIPAGTRVSGKHPAGIPEEDDRGSES